jgi:hypothetical protein
MTPTLQAALEAQAIREGLLTRDDYVYGKLHDFSSAYTDLGRDSNILSYLCLFPEIEGTESEFDVGRLAAKTGFKFTATSPRDIRSQFLAKELGIKEDKLKAFMEECHERTYQSFAEQRRYILPILYASLVNEWKNATARLRRTSAFYTDSLIIKEAALSAIDLMTGWYGSDLASPPWRYGTGAEEMLVKEAGVSTTLLQDPDFELWLDKLDDFYVRHFATIFWSGINDKALAAGVPGRRREVVSSDEREAAANLAALVSVSFRDELRVVPDPRGIEEAVEMSNSKEMARLREKIFEWLSTVGSGQVANEERIRKDIEKASNEIRFLARYRELNSSPWVFNAKFALGFVPVISNVVSVIDYGMSWYDNISSQRNIWVSVR